MSIILRTELESKIRSRAEAEGLSIEAYLERLVLVADHESSEELESLALEGLHSGSPIEISPSYWSEKHARLDKQLGRTVER